MKKRRDSGELYLAAWAAVYLFLFLMFFLLSGCLGESEAPCTFLDSDTIVNVYEETEQCVGLSGEIPTVEYNSFSHFGIPPAEGLYIPSSGSVWLNGDLGLSCTRQRDVLRHEYVHHLLSVNGLGLASSAHDHPAFGTCGAIVGEP